MRVKASFLRVSNDFSEFSCCLGQVEKHEKQTSPLRCQLPPSFSFLKAPKSFIETRAC